MKAAWECKCGRGFTGIRAYRLHFRRCQNLPSAQRGEPTERERPNEWWLMATGDDDD